MDTRIKDGKKHNCGGTILVGGSNREKHYYCDNCGAFILADYGEPEDIPTGIDPEANRQAWDAGDICSPEEKV